MSRLDDARAVAAEINKKYGDGMIVLASEVSDAVPRLPTGSLGLDVILGGGWPANQWVELIGDPSSAKTAVALKTVATNQSRDGDFTTVWIAAEKWVSQYARMCGVDPDRVLVVETNDMENAYDTAIRFAESRSVDAIVIDSLPALVPSAEDEKDMEGNTVGKAALLTGRFFRKVGKATKRSMILDERPVLGIMVNQWRQRIGVLYGDPRTTPGGVGKDYAYFVRVEVRRGDWIEVGPAHNKDRIGQVVQLRTIKNKTAPSQRVAFVDFYFDDGGVVPPGGYDTAKEITALALLEGIITKRGAFYYYAEHRWQGQSALLDGLRGDPLLYDEVRTKVVEQLAVNVH
jgi:recombination protein RecA